MSSSFKNPRNTAIAIANTGEIKNNSQLSHTVLLAFLAGAYMAFGVLVAEISNAGMLDLGYPIGLSKFVFGAVYPVGSIIILVAGSELFTGNILYMTIGLLDNKASFRGLVRNWILSWIFNFVGALFVAYVLAYLSGAIFVDSAVTSEAMGMAMVKVNLPWHEAFIRGIGCNWLVCLGNYLAFASEDVIGKIFGIWFPTMTFATIGFEQSVANMFFLPLGLFLGAPGVNWISILWNNLIPVTLGNVVGGIIFVSLIYYKVYLNDRNPGS